MPLANPFHEGSAPLKLLAVMLVAVKNSDDETGKWGYIDKQFATTRLPCVQGSDSEFCLTLEMLAISFQLIWTAVMLETRGVREGRSDVLS